MRRILWFLAFFLVLVLGDRLGGGLLQYLSAESGFRYTRMYSGRAPADILLLGNSRGLTFYQPWIEAKTGKQTLNLSYNGLPADAANALVQDYLERYRAPELLLIDITLCDRINDELLSGFALYAPQSARFDTLIRRKIPEVWWGCRVSELYRCNHELYQRNLYYRARSDEDWLLDRVMAPQAARAVRQHRYELDVSPYLIEQLRSMTEAARRRGVRVELVIGPYFPDFVVKNLDTLRDAVEEATGLPVRDYRQALSNPADFGDFMHPNKQGSERYLELLFGDIY